MQAGVDPAIMAALSAALQGPLSPLPSHMAEPRPQPRSMQRPSAGWLMSTERDGSCLARLTVDALKVGSLLGKRGGNIAQIRQVGLFLLPCRACLTLTGASACGRGILVCTVPGAAVPGDDRPCRLLPAMAACCAAADTAGLDCSVTFTEARCLAHGARLEQVSGAVVKLAEGRGRGEPRVLEVWGAPEQVQAAQNLVQAFLLVGHQQPEQHER